MQVMQVMQVGAVLSLVHHPQEPAVGHVAHERMAHKEERARNGQ